MAGTSDAGTRNVTILVGSVYFWGLWAARGLVIWVKVNPGGEPGVVGGLFTKIGHTVQRVQGIETPL